MLQSHPLNFLLPHSTVATVPATGRSVSTKTDLTLTRQTEFSPSFKQIVFGLHDTISELNDMYMRIGFPKKSDGWFSVQNSIRLILRPSQYRLNSLRFITFFIIAAASLSQPYAYTILHILQAPEQSSHHLRILSSYPHLEILSNFCSYWILTWIIVHVKMGTTG